MSDLVVSQPAYVPGLSVRCLCLSVCMTYICRLRKWKRRWRGAKNINKGPNLLSPDIRAFQKWNPSYHTAKEKCFVSLLPSSLLLYFLRYQLHLTSSRFLSNTKDPQNVSMPPTSSGLSKQKAQCRNDMRGDEKCMITNKNREPLQAIVEKWNRPRL